MRHDPERTAAAYLAGELAPRQRERFEAHVLGCDDCWREVTAGRQGRALAESLREVAPQHLRERIRATIAAAPAPPRRRIRLGTRMPALLGVVAALLAAAVAGGLLAARERAPASRRRSPRRWPATGRAWRPGPRPASHRRPASLTASPGRAPPGASSPACQWSPTPTRTSPGTDWCCWLPASPSRRPWARGTPRRVPPGRPGWTGRCCTAPTTPRRPLWSAPTRPKSWSQRSSSGCGEAVRPRRARARQPPPAATPGSRRRPWQRWRWPAP